MKKIFVTGASGYVGRNLLAKAVEKYKITACDISRLDAYSDIKWVQPLHELDKDALEKSLKGCDSIIHLAQSPHYRDFPEKALEVFEVNVNSVMHVFDVARKVGIKNVVIFSSGGVYGTREDKLHELEHINPLDFYLATKVMSEFIAREYREFMNVHIVRPFFIYGPHQNGKLIPLLIKRIENGEPVFVNGLGNGGKINPVYIDDVVDAILELIEFNEGSSTINLAGPDILSMEDIINIIGEAVGREPKIEYNTSGKGLFMLADISRVKAQLKTLKMVSFREGIDKIIRGDD